MNLAEQNPGAPEYYIPASASLLERRPRTLKHDDTFAMFDHYGDLAGSPTNPEGLYHKDTRYLSLLQLQVEGRKPLLLSSTVQNNNALLTVDLTNPDIYLGKTRLLARDSVHLLRSKFLWEAACYEAIVAHNYSAEPCSVVVGLSFEADFRDVFEVRGHVRPARGSIERFMTGRNRVVMRYTGLDRQVRDTELIFDPPPDRLQEAGAEWRLMLGPGASRELFVTVACGAAGRADCRFVANMRRAHRARVRTSRRFATVRTSNQVYNEHVCRSMADLDMLTTETPQGPYPYAGIPWFSTAFGRDAIITAIEMLVFDPFLARGVLQFLAAAQARELDSARDAEPGKILHEMRQGEMAALGEVPFGWYYGSVDSTPLFVMLAGLYWEHTGDLETTRQLWPNICAALEWMDRYGDADGDGFIEYRRKSVNGLSNQGWKDSEDSIFHADGKLARGSIALCEVQAYAYAAKRHAAAIAEALGDGGFATRLKREARLLQLQFEGHYWLEEQGFYALALDGEKRPCAVLSSNAGHVLFGGIAAPDRALRLARQLTAGQLFSGWGVRTIGAAQARYNPMSYHNGSVWPHDNALIALGLARYGCVEEALKIMTALFHTSINMDLRRLPELFCGMRRKPQRGPTSYPVACSPQAWASATPFALLTAVLGLQLDARAGRVRFVHPRLPEFLDEVEIRNLRIGAGALDVRLRRSDNSVGVTVLSRSGSASVEVVP